MSSIRLAIFRKQRPSYVEESRRHAIFSFKWSKELHLKAKLQIYLLWITYNSGGLSKMSRKITTFNAVHMCMVYKNFRCLIQNSSERNIFKTHICIYVDCTYLTASTVRDIQISLKVCFRCTDHICFWWYLQIHLNKLMMGFIVRCVLDTKNMITLYFCTFHHVLVILSSSYIILAVFDAN